MAVWKGGSLGKTCLICRPKCPATRRRRPKASGIAFTPVNPQATQPPISPELAWKDLPAAANLNVEESVA